MKICLICNTQAEDTAPTCANCGHASWSAVVEPKPMRFDTIKIKRPVVNEAVLAETVAAPKRRGARRKKGSR